MTEPAPPQCLVREHLGPCDALAAWKRCGTCPDTTFATPEAAGTYLWANGFRLASVTTNIWNNAVGDQGYVEPVVDEANAIVGFKAVIERVRAP